MANKIPVKAIYTNSNVTSLGEYVSGDTISTTYTDAKVTKVAGAEGEVSNAQLASGISASGILTTANVTEVNNLYFTNARVYANVESIGYASNSYVNTRLLTKANVADLTTANVSEVTNLYFSNARAREAISVTGAATYDNTTGVINVTGGVTSVGGATGAVSNAQLAAAITSSGLLTTSNVSEGANLYYTVARANSAIDDRVTKSFIDNLNVDADTLDNQDGSYYLDWTNTTNKPDPVVNVTLTGDVTGAAEAVLSDVTSNTITISTTIAPNSVALGTDTTGAYVSNLIPGTGVTIAGLGNEGTTPTISIGQSVATNSDVTFANVTVTGNLLVQGNTVLFNANTLVISDPLIQTGVNPVGDAIDLGFFSHYIGGSPSIERHAGLFRDATDGQFKLFTNLDPEPTTTVDTANATYQSANLVVNFVVGKVTDISNHSTTNLSEGSNLYYTNARVYANVESIGYASNSYVNTRLLTKANVADLTTANVTEVSNLYFTNARVYANVESIGYASNSYVNTRLLTKANVADLTTSNVSEGSNLYFTNTRAVGALTGGSGITIGSNGLITSTVSGGVTSVGGSSGAVSNAQLACSIISSGVLTTANVSEVTNLYFTNTRAVGALTAGSNMSIAANGLLTATVAAASGGGGGDFNTNINRNLGTGNISTGQNLVFTAPSTSGKRYIVRSIYITNVGNATSNINGAFDGSTYASNIAFANTIPVPYAGAVELLTKPKVLQPNDKIFLSATHSDRLQGIITYETQDSTSLFGAGVKVASANTYANLYITTSNSVIESILLSNDNENNDALVTVAWTNSALTILGYYAFGLNVPQDSTVELLKNPIYLENGHAIRVSCNKANRIEAIIAGKSS